MKNISIMPSAARLTTMLLIVTSACASVDMPKTFADEAASPASDEDV